MPEEPETPRKAFKFKEPQFETVNPQRPPAPRARGSRPPKLTLDPVQPVQVRELYRPAGAPPPGPPPPAGGPRPTPAPPKEAKKLILKDFAAEQAKAKELAAQASVGSRRKRDYLVSLAIGNLACLVAIVIMPVLGFAAMVLYNVALAWILYGVLDDY